MQKISQEKINFNTVNCTFWGRYAFVKKYGYFQMTIIIMFV